MEGASSAPSVALLFQIVGVFLGILKTLARGFHKGQPFLLFAPPDLKRPIQSRNGKIKVQPLTSFCRTHQQGPLPGKLIIIFKFYKTLKNVFRTKILSQYVKYVPDTKIVRRWYFAIVFQKLRLKGDSAEFRTFLGATHTPGKRLDWLLS